MSALVGTLRPDTWPKPDYANPETRVPLILGFMISGGILVAMFSGGRLYAKTQRSNKRALGSDDWMMAVSAIMMIGVDILGCISTLYGSGRHTWDVRPAWPSIWGKIDLATYVLFIPSVSLTKISLCVSYLKLFPSRENQWFCYFSIAFLSLWSTTFIFLIIFACQPIAGFWDPNLPNVKCLDLKVILILTGALNSVTDFTVFLWPVKTLWNIQLPLLHRVSLVVAFGIGCLVCIAGVLRAWYMEVYFSSNDPYWKCAALWVIVSVEGNFGIICGCLPTLKPIAKKIFPRLFGSRSDLAVDADIKSSRSALDFDDYEGGDELQDFPFQNISMPREGRVEHKGSDKEGTMTTRDEEAARSPVSDRSVRFVFWTEIGPHRQSTVPENGIKLVKTLTIHSDKQDLDQEHTQPPLPRRRDDDGDDGSEEHILPPEAR